MARFPTVCTFVIVAITHGVFNRSIYFSVHTGIICKIVYAKADSGICPKCIDARRHALTVNAVIYLHIGGRMAIDNVTDVKNEQNWVFSYSQISKYRLCPQRYWQHYLNNNKEPTTDAMAFSTYLVHNPIETWVAGDQWVDWQASWELWWANMLAEAELPGDYDDRIYNVDTGKQCLALYKANPLKGEVTNVEEKVVQLLGGYRYGTKPDFRFNDGARQWSVDIKFTTSWDIKPLLPYDDQLLGQAICTGSDGFLRVTFHHPKKGKLTGPHVEGHLVDEVHRTSWMAATIDTIRRIEDERSRVRGNWGKWPGACYAFGRPCSYMPTCKLGVST
jgi:hypothetical protein